MNTNPAASRERIVFLDALRALCCFLVIVNHSYDAIGLASVSPLVRRISFVILYAVKIAVPVFLMISGCTLLTKADSLRKSLSRFLRIIAVLVLFSFVYEVDGFLRGDLLSLSLSHFIGVLYTLPITNAYWYLLTYAGLLLMLPFLQKMVRAMKREDFLFYFAVSFFFVALWPLLVKYMGVSDYSDHFRLPLFGTHICYMMLGYFLTRHVKRSAHPALLLAAYAACVCASAFVTDYSFVSSDGQYYLYLDNISLLPIVLSSICIFALAQRIRLGGRAAAVVRHLGRLSFGVYLISDLVLSRLYPVFTALSGCMPPLAAVTLYQLLTFAVSLAVSEALTRVPLLRRLI